MKKSETKLLASRAVNKIGNVMYDYGNSTWIAGLGLIGAGILLVSGGGVLYSKEVLNKGLNRVTIMVSDN